jgi:AcrR family transcriptional regulator
MLEPKQARSAATRRRLLDAAVEILVEEGYAGISAATVARRAGVSRGAHQHHFANRETLAIESVRHMSERELELLRAKIAQLPRGRSRVSGAIDFIFELYSGTFFAAILELSLAARREPLLREAVAEEEREMSETIHQLGIEVLGEEAFAAAERSHRWTTAIATIRGLALLRLLRHSQATIDRHWSSARREVLAGLTEPSGAR